MSQQEINLFEVAARKKLRFKTTKGLATAEDLWDLSLAELDRVYAFYSTALRNLQVDSLLTVKSDDATLWTLQRDVVLVVFTTLQKEQDARVMAKVRKDEIARLNELLAKKGDAALENLSTDDIKARIAALKAS